MSATATLPTVDDIRLAVSEKLDPKRRAEYGQFMTPWAIARFMASMFRNWPKDSSALDPGAGVGSLTEALAERFVESTPAGSTLPVTAYEIDPILIDYRRDRLAQMKASGRASGWKIETEIIDRDFIQEGAFRGSFGAAPYSHTILNPPYKKSRPIPSTGCCFGKRVLKPSIFTRRFSD